MTRIKADATKLIPKTKPATDTSPKTEQKVPAKLKTDSDKKSAQSGTKPQDTQEKQELATTSSSTIRVSVGLLENLMTMVSRNGPDP